MATPFLGAGGSAAAGVDAAAATGSATSATLPSRSVWRRSACCRVASRTARTDDGWGGLPAAACPMATR
eukprot:6539752-Prymnesium_polylepis.2